MNRPLKRPSRRATRGQAPNGVSYASSPLLAAKTPPWRSKLLVAGVGLAFAVLLGRAAYVQIVGTDFYQRQGEARYARTLDLPASRGRILDRNGLVLATSVPAPSLWVIPKEFDSDPAQRARLAKLLKLTPRELGAKVDDDNAKFAWLARQVDEEVAAQVRALKLKGVHEVREYKRKYPEGEAAAHIVGFTNFEEKGQEGAELSFQKRLAGRAGSRNVIRDRLGRIVEDTGNSVQPVDGQDVRLSVDSKVQYFAYQRLRDAVLKNKAKAGSVVVLDARSGEVLAMANYPSYNPGDRRDLSGDQLRNRALTDTFEPGSTMKPFVAALALERGTVTPRTTVQTAPGWMTVTGSVIRDSHPHGPLTVAEVIQKSSNVGIVKLAQQMPMQAMHELYTQIGLGAKPQLELPGAVSGRLRPVKTWKPIEHATMAYGYGLSASLLHLARAYTVFAHDGQLLPVTLLRNLPEGAEVRAPTPSIVRVAQAAGPADGGSASAPAGGVRVISSGTAREIREMLRMAAGDGGTAPQAQTVGYSVGGKSGTARKQEGKGYGSSYRSWFVGMAPISDPRVIVAVMIDEPDAGIYYGGQVSGPVFSEIVQQSLRTMKVAPDLAVEPGIVARPPAAAVPESF